MFNLTWEALQKILRFSTTKVACSLPLTSADKRFLNRIIFLSFFAIMLFFVYLKVVFT